MIFFLIPSLLKFINSAYFCSLVFILFFFLISLIFKLDWLGFFHPTLSCHFFNYRNEQRLLCSWRLNPHKGEVYLAGQQQSPLQFGRKESSDLQLQCFLGKNRFPRGKVLWLCVVTSWILITAKLICDWSNLLQKYRSIAIQWIWNWCRNGFIYRYSLLLSDWQLFNIQWRGWDAHKRTRKAMPRLYQNFHKG